LDPKRSMGIGGVKNRVNSVLGTANPDVVEEYISLMAQDKGGAFEMYLPEKEKEKLYWTTKFLGKKNVKVVDIDPDDDRLPEKYSNRFHYTEQDIKDYLFKRFVQPQIDKGWEIFWEEDNISIIQYILVKYYES